MDKNKYVDAMKNINVTDNAKQRILNNSKNFNYEKGKTNIMYRKKAVLLAIAAVFVVGITVFAASGVISSWCSSSSSDSEYKTLPTSEQCIKDVGFKPSLIEKFENGYTFKEGSIVKNSLKDDNDNDVEKFKSFDFTYGKDNDEVMFSQSKINSKMDSVGNKILTENGIDFYYNSYTNKSVPSDYKLTEDDKKAEKNGEFVFSYGSDKITVSEIQGLTWVSDNMHYNLTQIDGKLSSDELLKMAKEIME